MKKSIFAGNATDARRLAQEALKTEHVHISCVFFVPGQPGMREWVFSTVLST